MFQELDLVALSHKIQSLNLEQDDLGTIVFVHDKSHYEVEFVTAQGETIGVLTLSDEDIRPIEKREILHVREIHAAT